MASAIDLSIRQGWIDEEVRRRSLALIERAGLPVAAPSEIGVEQYLDLMAVDKKAVDGQIRLVLLRALGEAFVSDDYDRANLEATLAA